jgi:aldose 1-epimerase
VAEGRVPGLTPIGPILSVESRPFGTVQGIPVDRYTLAREGGVELSILTYGGVVQSLRVPDGTNVVLGFSELAGYVAAGDAYLGAIVGRCANRIAGGELPLDGHVYRLSRNERGHHLHGGAAGFDKKVWRARPRIAEHEIAVVLLHTSEDGDEGYPGRIDVEAVYSLALDDTVRIELRAVTTRPTVVNLTSHPMFNLAGDGRGTILEHELWVDADRYTPVDAELIPTGELAPVAGTPMDFRRPAEVGSRLDGDYDHNFVLNERDGSAARLVDRRSRRALEIRTTEPGLQVYTGGNLAAASGGAYERFAGVALEPQRFPDSPHHLHFPTAVLRPGERYESTTELRFSSGLGDQ